jgi:predicted O-methyltransferase YrrM
MNLFAQIESILPDLKGWCPPEKAQALAAMVVAMRPEMVVEIGVWTGTSLIPMALALKQNKSGTIWGIDPWSTQASVEGQVNPADQKFWSDATMHEVEFNRFMGNLDKYDLHDVVRIARKRSNDVVPPEKIGLLHIDGNHGPQAIMDVRRFAPKVVFGGLVVMDDLGWGGGFVGEAADVLKNMGYKQLYYLGTGAVYQRI